MRRSTRTATIVTAAFACSAAAIGLTSGTAAADNKNISVLDGTCDNGRLVSLSLASQGAFPSSLHVVGSTSNFTVHSVTLTPYDGSPAFTIKNSGGVDNNKDLVNCSHDGNSFRFTWTGFFTPGS
jgi:hypothetical protein